jgi:hypothetical protein
MEYDILYVGQSVCLINCFLDREKLTYGFGYFASNTPPEIILRDSRGNFVVKVAIPDEIVTNPIMEVMGDAHDTNILKRLPTPDHLL